MERDAVEILKKHAKTFSFASLFLGKQRTDEAARLYRFCRTVDDIADESMDTGHARKQLDELQNDLKSGTTQDPLVKDFLDLAQSKGLDKQAAMDLVDGVKSDLEHVRIQNMRDLETYCYNVAGTVGILMCPILGTSDPNALKFGRDLGKAMQLTNICRDIKEDAQNDRVYLPEEKISNALPDAAGQQNETVQNACKDLLDVAERLYDTAEYGIAYLPFRSKLCILIAARLYRQIGIKLANKGCKYWQGRVYTTRPEKLWISFKSVLRLFSSRKYWVKINYEQV